MVLVLVPEYKKGEPNQELNRTKPEKPNQEPNLILYITDTSEWVGLAYILDTLMDEAGKHTYLVSF